MDDYRMTSLGLDPAFNHSFSGPSYGEAALPDFDFIPLTDGGVYDNSGMEAFT
jgi:hypothetical protein